MPYDDTIPQNTEGDQYLSVSITPTNTTNKIIIMANVWGSVSAIATISAAIFQDSNANALAAVASLGEAIGSAREISIIHNLTDLLPGSSYTFKLRIGPSAAATFTLNGVAAARKFGGASSASLTIIEVRR
jgi:hypothetical protein